MVGGQLGPNKLVVVLPLELMELVCEEDAEELRPKPVIESNTLAGAEEPNRELLEIVEETNRKLLDDKPKNC